MREKKFVITREVKFFAAHNIEGRPIHIHMFIVSFQFSGTREQFSPKYDSTMLINLYDIDKLWNKHIFPELVNDDTKRINIVNSTCEAIAEWVFDKAMSLKGNFSNCTLDSVSIFDGDVRASVGM